MSSQTAPRLYYRSPGHPGSAKGAEREPPAPAAYKLYEGDLTMPKSDIEKVLTVFQGIGERDADLATKYMNPKKYIQHNPHAADGAGGLREYISQFPRENHHLQVVRAFQDGPYVFTQEEGLILGQN